MKKDFDQLCVAFNDRASAVFFTLYNNFKNSTQHIDRQRDENVFQQQISKYATALKQQLQSITTEIIYQSQPLKDVDQLQKTFYETIDAYIHEFIQKAKAL